MKHRLVDPTPMVSDWVGLSGVENLHLNKLSDDADAGVLKTTL